MDYWRTLIGGIIGAVVAQKVEMTSMPEMVALFNGSGGVASLMVGWAALYNIDNSTFTNITILLSIIIGGMTFSGSILAWGKLSEVMTSAAVVFGAQRIVNAGILIGMVACAVLFCLEPSVSSPYLYAVIGLSVAVWHHGGTAHWRGRYAGGHFIVEQLLRPGRLCRGFCY